MTASPHIHGHGHATARHHLAHQVDHALLDHRRLAGSDQIELGLVDVDADDVVAVAGQACERNRADVPKAEYATFMRIPG